MRDFFPGFFVDTTGTQGTLEFWRLVWCQDTMTMLPCLHPDPPISTPPHSTSIPTPGPRTPEPFRSSYNRLEGIRRLEFLPWRMVTSSRPAWSEYMTRLCPDGKKRGEVGRERGMGGKKEKWRGGKKGRKTENRILAIGGPVFSTSFPSLPLPFSSLLLRSPSPPIHMQILRKVTGSPGCPSSGPPRLV